MTPAELTDPDIAELALDLRTRGQPFAIATVIRTAGATAAQPGAKALLDERGTILQGWIGGGCVRAALKKATAQAIEQQQPQLISLQPQDLLDEKGVTAGDNVDGVEFARNGCPSEGSVDIFVEAMLPLPELIIFGASPVAHALASLAGRFQWAIRQATCEKAPSDISDRMRMVVVATQGKDDLASLKAALSFEAKFVAFVGSKRKFDALSAKLIEAGETQTALDAVHAPAGLSINAVTPDEIALSILAQLTRERRQMREHPAGTVSGGILSKQKEEQTK